MCCQIYPHLYLFITHLPFLLDCATYTLLYGSSHAPSSSPPCFPSSVLLSFTPDSWMIFRQTLPSHSNLHRHRFLSPLRSSSSLLHCSALLLSDARSLVAARMVRSLKYCNLHQPFMPSFLSFIIERIGLMVGFRIYVEFLKFNRSTKGMEPEK